MAIDSFSGKYSFLSNFHNSPVKYVGKLFPTLEHAFVVAKCKTWSEFERQTGLTYEEYCNKTPGQAKRVGRSVSLIGNWDLRKYAVMHILLKSKFKNPKMAERLDRTGSELLMEGNNWHDNIWGVCTCPRCRREGKGENSLGLLLMKVREAIRASS